MLLRGWPGGILFAVNDGTLILQAIDQGDPQAADKLLPVVYRELRELAASKLSREKPGQALDATALVHLAYVRLVSAENRATKKGISPITADGPGDCQQTTH